MSVIVGHGETYFMTDQQRDAVVGRVAREKRDADHELALLRSESKRIAERLRAIASWLEDNPGSIVFENESLDARAGAWQNRVYDSDFDFATFKKLVSDLKVIGKRSADKTQELETLLRS